MFLCRVGYIDGEYVDAEDVEVSVADFGKLSSSTSAELDSIFVNYFVERGYIADRTIRAAPYDWRLGGGIVH